MFYYYLIAVNILAFALMGIDKYKAQHHLWRIPEKTLFLSAIIGGSAGAIFGMNLFRHKTKHWYFVFGMPLILFIQVGLWYWFSTRYQFSLEKYICIYYYHYK